MANYHLFDVDFAKKYGMAEAVIYENIKYWLNKNKENSKHFYDGYYWTYNSTKAFSKLFPYLSESKISRALKHLEDEKIILTGMYNKVAYDRTKWYTIIATDEFIYRDNKNEDNEQESDSNVDSKPFCNMTNGLCNMTNGSTQIDEPIPDINPIINTDISIKMFADANVQFFIDYFFSHFDTVAINLEQKYVDIINSYIETYSLTETQIKQIIDYYLSNKIKAKNNKSIFHLLNITLFKGILSRLEIIDIEDAFDETGNYNY